MENGEGFRKLYPPLATPDYLDYLEDFACIVRHGMDSSITIDGTEYTFPMPENKGLTAAEIANIYNYIAHQWHPETARSNELEMNEQLARCRQ